MFRIPISTFLPACLLAFSAHARAEGGALLFDGVDDFCRVMDSNSDFDFGTSTTVEAWIRPSTPTPGIQRFISAGGIFLSRNGFNGNMTVSFGPTNTALATNVVTPGEWTHLAGTFDGTTIRVYANGVLQSSTVHAGSANSTFDLILGSAAATTGFYEGELDEVRLWNVVRTDAEILEDFDRELSGNEAGLVGYYQFDETSGQVILDSSTGGNDGVLGNSGAVEASDPIRTVSTAPVRARILEGALLFDGVDDICTVIDSNNDFDLMTGGTLEVWFRVDTPGPARGLVNATGVRLSASNGFGTLLVTAPGASGSSGATSPGGAPMGEWAHLAGSFDGSNLRVYSNGVLIATTPGPSSAADTSALLLGTLGPFFGTFSGAMDEVRVWNTVRTDAEISDSFGTELTGTETGLVGYYKFNEGAGQAILDSSSAGNHGVLGDTAAVESSDPLRIESTLVTPANPAGGALSLDGLDDFCRVLDSNDSFDLGTAGTVETWMRVDSTLVFNSPVSTNGVALAADGPNAQFYTVTPGVTFVEGPGTVSAGTWVHLAGTYDGNIHRLYVNGQLVGSLPAPGSLTDTPVLILGRINDTFGYLGGEMDELRIWNTVRSDTQIAASFNKSLVVPQLGLVGYYQFDAPFGQTLRDSSGCGNHGTLGGTDATGADDPERVLSDAPFTLLPRNDECFNAIGISAGTQITGTLVGATNDGMASCGSSSAATDVWYSFTATELGVLEVTTCGTHDLGGVDMGMDTVLSLHGDCSGFELACNDDFAGCAPGLSQGDNRDSQVMVGMVPGQSVLIRVSYYNGTGPAQSFPGPFLLNVSFTEGGFVNVCNGDGGDQMGCTECTCNNNAPAGTVGGCINQTGNSARLIPADSPSVSAVSPMDLSFDMTGGNPGTFAILLSGNNLAPQNPANPCFGLGSGLMGGSALDGLRCAVGGVQRHGGRPMDANGDVGLTTNGWGGPNGPTQGIAAQGGFVPGQTRYFQVFYRALTTEGCGTGQNSSQAVGVTFQP